MAYTTITLTNGREIKKAPVGFSWTTFFWGGWPALFRQDWAWGLGILIAGICTYGFAGIVFAFFYNKIYIKTLVNQGYFISDTGAATDNALKEYLGFVTLPKAPNV